MGKKALLWIALGYVVGSFLPIGNILGAFKSKGQ